MISGTEYLTPEQAAEQLQLHPKTVRRLLAEGKLPGQKVGGRQWRISAAVLRDHIEGKREAVVVAKAGSPTHANRGLGALKDVLHLPPGWDSLEAEEEAANQFEVVREAKGLPAL